jgi:hypothetical protein
MVEISENGEESSAVLVDWYLCFFLVPELMIWEGQVEEKGKRQWIEG